MRDANSRFCRSSPGGLRPKSLGAHIPSCHGAVGCRMRFEVRGRSAKSVKYIYVLVLEHWWWPEPTPMQTKLRLKSIANAKVG